MPDDKRFLRLIGAIPLLLCVVALELPRFFPAWTDLTAFFLYRQDRWLLACLLATLAISFVALRPTLQELYLPVWGVVALAAATVALCAIGHHWILCGYDMSRDEQMAVFDSGNFVAGRLTARLPAAWQQHADALNLHFMLPVSHPVAWASAYLPMNAMLRALVGEVADPALTGPFLTGLGLLLLWLCARRLWPREREAAVVAVLLYIASGQILVSGMTAYAMPAHLTLDLLWLWLFLRDKPTADAGALAVAAVATGLHQPLFHPLFALPFLFSLVITRDWKRTALYAIGYAAICAVWLAWPMVIYAQVAGPGSQTEAAGTDYLSRLLKTMAAGDATRVPDMTANLLRFAAWQPVLLLPLMVAGVILGRRERLTPALAVSVLLPIVVMGVILPYQGHGFGYRYLQGVLGPAILLAVQGFRSLVPRYARLRPLLLRTTTAGAFVIFTLQAYLAHAFYAPSAAVDARIRGSGADFVIIGSGDVPFALDLVLNRADLSNRPIRLIADEVDNDLIAFICRRNARVSTPTSALFKPIDDYFLISPRDIPEARFASLSPELAAAGCKIERLGFQ